MLIVFEWHFGTEKWPDVSSAEEISVCSNINPFTKHSILSQLRRSVSDRPKISNKTLLHISLITLCMYMHIINGAVRARYENADILSGTISREHHRHTHIIYNISKIVYLKNELFVSYEHKCHYFIRLVMYHTPKWYYHLWSFEKFTSFVIAQ